MDPAALIDRARYPVDRLESAAGRALVAGCREQLARDGACELPDFLSAEVTAAMAREAAALAGEAHRSAGKATPYLELPAPDWPAEHPRRSFNPFSLGAVPYDRIPPASALRRLYEWDGLTAFIAACLGKERLVRYADPLGALNVAVMEDGDELEWHFDQTDFVVSLALQSCETGGDFLYAPRIRSGEDEHYDDVARLLAGDATAVRRLPMRPGTLLLFEGRYSIHCVSPVRGATPRLVALLAYDTKPGTCASPLLQQARYGRVVRPPGEAAEGAT
ncbi:MAG TPA: hypothetical protein VHQ66_02825 [Myxococcota bacterium]|nr:hypothetical protein [Myxococcota bacterium]